MHGTAKSTTLIEETTCAHDGIGTFAVKYAEMARTTSTITTIPI
jgi:hypothetical protein